MKRTLFSTILAAALVVPATSAFAGQRGGGVPHGGGFAHAAPHGTVPMHGHPGYGGRGIIAPYYYGGFYGPGWAYYDPFWGAYEWGAPYGYVAPTDVAEGGLRIEVTPKDAQVYVDGSYAGVVNDFDGHFQHLDLPPGGHHVELRADGFAPLAFDAYIQPDHTTDYKGRLTPLS